ncbi:hypothetical protein SAMN05216559_1917 [Halomicrobium zhouii]|uniref:Uncharacterized protein n=1 Tax=Halomicrobium zhouii TaxID=767519 RepID=A0A1I6L2R4_9EURY|nr:hypothetical protein [Halomicrobium zhouii]SFR97803.1 hypothetical protein SAMN05216559_1917 [Halomicrobium zhouii]
MKPHVLREADKVDDALPDTNVRTGTLSAKLNRMPGPKRTEATEQFDELDPQTKRYLGDTDVDAPASRSADLFRNAGPGGRKALDDLAETDRRAADALVEMDDAATQRRFVTAYDSGDVDADELSTAVKRYDDRNAEGTEFADDVIAQTGDDGVDLLSTDVCNSPCHGTIRSVYEYTKQSDGLDDKEAKDLLKAYDEAEDVTTGPGSNGPGEVQEAVNSLDQRDVDGIRDVMRHTQGNEKGYKEIAGETDVANKLLDGDNGIEAGDIEMQRPIRDVDDAPITKSDVDVDVDSELTVRQDARIPRDRVQAPQRRR